jgi:Ca2+-binding RTX toxin-like protein
VTEAAGAGTDTVMSPVSWVLGSNLENLTLTGIATINGAGNVLDNLLIGNGAANTLRGLGRDTYDGSAGDDALIDLSTTSGVSIAGIGSGSDTVIDSGGIDHRYRGGITASQLAFTRRGNHPRSRWRVASTS